MNDYIEQHRNDPVSVASLIHFADGVTLEQAKAAIMKLERQGLIMGHTTREYQEAFGSPVWYIP
jgi:hypothetical protein